MTDKDLIAERGRALEDEYFRKRDRQLLEKMRAASAQAQARRDLGATTGVTDPELLQELEALGFTPDTVALLPLVPIVQVAWAEGDVSTREREIIVQLARSRGIVPGSPADHLLEAWLAERPDPSVFVRATRLIRAMLDVHPSGGLALDADALVEYCEQVAAASGGFLGLNRISSEERELLAGIAGELKSRRS